MSRVFGANPRPRILLEQIPDELHDSFHKSFPTVKVVTLRDEVDQAEYDVLVTGIAPEGADPHLFVVTFSEPRGQHVVIERVQAGQANFPVMWLGTSKGHEFHVSISIDAALQRYIQTRVIPVVRARQENFVMGETFGGTKVITPYLTTARGEVLAGRFQRVSGSECWVLPADAVQHAVECVRIAVDLWRQQDLNRFPYPVADWAKDPRWMTVPEQEAASDLHGLRQRRDQMLAELAAEEQALEPKLSDATTRADGEERRLLTTQGDVLVRAAQSCFEDFGFKVQYMDDVWKVGDRREDLRVSLVSDPDWSNITEVRGYARGAELNDLLRISRFRSRYMQDEGHVPSSAWYVANELIATDPGSRPAVLHSNDKEVETFGEDDGLAISSVSLFDMLMDLRRGLLSQQEAQHLLKGGRGRLVYEHRR